MQYLSSCLLLVGWLSTTALASTVHNHSFSPDYILRVTSVTLPIACESRQSVVVNGTSPGPTLNLTAGAVTWVRVYNDMTDQNLTMHWHGIVQRMAPFADGTSMASQWPIPPGHFFDYEIQTKPNDAGTYFYHSHVGMQALSCSGALIVDDCRAPPFAYDGERILQFSDYFNQSEVSLRNDLDGVPYQGTGETNAVLLNGKGIGLGHVSKTGPGGCGLPVIDVEPGKTYRFRFIGSTGLSFLTLGIESHSNLTIIQADAGEYNRPVSVDHLQLGSGQRFDALVRTKTAEELAADGNRSTYYIQWETRDRPSTYTGYGVLRYRPEATIPAAPSSPLLRLPETMYDWLEYTLTPLNPAENQAPTAEEVTRRIIIPCEQLVNPKTRQTVWELAHLSWTDASVDVPVLVDIYKRGEAAVPDWEAAQKNYGWDPRTLSFPARVGEVLEIVFQNTGSLVNNSGAVESHPFHAHGQHYYDIGSGNGTYDPAANEAKIQQLGYQPVRRDTTMLYQYVSKTVPGGPAGWRAWRIRVMDPGVWMIHCHILEHMMMGMQSVWVVGNASQIIKIPLEVSQGYFEYGGDVYGTESHDPTYHEYFVNNGTRCAAAAAAAAAPKKEPAK